MHNAARGQAALEYVILLAGILLIIFLTIAVMQALQGRSKAQIEESVGTWKTFVCLSKYLAEPDSTLLAYKLDGLQGGTTPDSSAKHNDGILKGGLPTLDSANCKFPPCLHFGAAPGHVESSKPIEGVGSMTFLAWIRFDDSGDGSQPVIAAIANSFDLSFTQVDYIVWSMDDPPPPAMEAAFHFSVWTGLFNPVIVDPEDMTLEGYHHIAATYNETTGTANVYIDGRLNATVSGPANKPMWHSNLPLSVGNKQNDASQAFKGNIDQVEFYSRELTAEEIMQEIRCQPA
ncbi:MAG: LamG domain-containing protein [Candidatus Micrarchaeota archaeon]